jgi:hypothetical protein
MNFNKILGYVAFFGLAVFVYSQYSQIKRQTKTPKIK